MKKTLSILICTFIFQSMFGQTLVGAWENYTISEEGEQLKNVAVYADGYQVLTTYNATSGDFIRCIGGSWNLIDNILIQELEFHSESPELVGTQTRFEVSVKEDSLVIVDSNIKYSRIDDGKPGALHGAWLMSGRVVDGNTQMRDTSGPRKTMKILSGTRFQWIAYNTETKQFMATGGGTYTTINGDYTENIEFFSRDNSRIGQSLKFNFELVDGNWHHSGLSSKGDPIYEIWSRR